LIDSINNRNWNKKMATVKKLNSSYTIDTTDVIITGNLTIAGTYDTQNVTNTNIVDKNLTLNVGEAGAGVGPAGEGTAGLIIDRGSLANVELRWNDTTDTWQITSDGATYANIVSSVTGGIALTNVSEDLSPTLGGNLDVSTYSIFTSSDATNISFAGNLQLNYSLVAPNLVANATVVYADTPQAGTSGIYVVNGAAANQELITKARSFGFSLLL
jgi:hypothetical protein